MKVELEKGVWLADGQGDPSRTLDENNAKDFASIKEATKALTRARTFRPFENAIIHDSFF